MIDPRAGVAAATRLPGSMAPEQQLGWALLGEALQLSGAEAGALQWLTGPQEQASLLQWKASAFNLPPGWGAPPQAGREEGWLKVALSLADSRHVLAAWQRQATATSTAPVGQAEQVYAVLSLLQTGPGAVLPGGGEGPLGDLARLAALQIEAGLNRERLDRENRALRAMARVAITLDPQSGESEVAGRALDLALQLGGFSRGALLLRQHGGALELSVARGMEPLEEEALRACPLDPYRSPQLALLAGSGSLSPQQLQAHPGLGPCFSPALKRFRSLPMGDARGLLGLLVLANEEAAGSFDEGLFDAVGPVLASQAGRAVETARLVAELAESKQRLESATDSLLQAERLADIGRLAAAVAHQIRNPLTIISATAELMIERLGPEHPLSPELERLAGKVSDTEAIVRDLMQLGKPLQVRMGRAGVVDRLRNVAQFVRAKAEGQGVRLVLAPSAGVDEAWMDPAQLERCLLDLSLNALQSMENGGVLELGCAPAGPAGVEAWVQDDGKGLAGLDPAQIFEPFISRRLGGTGLGLYNVQRVCQAMGASISGCERAEGRGARFSIILGRGELAPRPIHPA